MKNSIRILNIIIEDRIGGPQLRIVQVANRLKKKGVETIVALPGHNGGFQTLLKRKNIPFYELQFLRRPRLTFNPVEHLKYMFSFIPSILVLMRIIRDEQIDIVHQNDIRQIQGPIAAKLCNVKVLWHLQGISFPLISKIFIPFPYFLADRIVCAARAIGEGYFKPGRCFLRRSFGVLYAPVDTCRFKSQNNINFIREEYGINDSHKVIGMVGNLNPIKGHKYFIEAARLVKDKWKQTKFLIIGKKLKNRRAYIRKLEKLTRELGLEDSMFFTGERYDMPDVFSALDIFVLPSLSEACPMVLLEAMASEVPCVASSVGGIPEIIGNRNYGLLVPPKVPKRIAHAIDTILSDQQKAKDIARNGRQRAIYMFSLNICTERHYQAYRALIEDRTQENWTT